MPFGSEGTEDGIALAMSGGGFRATLFHIGSLWRLNQARLLRKLRRVSAVSGGSITAGVLAKEWSDLSFQNDVALAFEQRIVEPLRDFCRRSVDIPAIGGGILLPWVRASDLLIREYAQHLFGDFSLQDLLDEKPDEVPRFVFNATNLQTGRSFRFSKPYMGDYSIGLAKNPGIPLAQAVAASSAFPPFLSPVVLDVPPGGFTKPEATGAGAQWEGDGPLRLTDGGVYDNLGLETVWKRYRTALVSDAGAPFAMNGAVETAWHEQTLRALDIATDQARGLRKRWLMEQSGKDGCLAVYWGIDTDITGYKVPHTLPCDPDVVRPLARIRTRLNTFDDEEQERLINWGYALCDAALRRYFDATLPKGDWPFPGRALG